MGESKKNKKLMHKYDMAEKDTYDPINANFQVLTDDLSLSTLAFLST